VDPTSKRLIRHTEDEAALKPKPVKKVPVKTYVPPISFSQRLKKQNRDTQFSQFINMFNKLHINIPFADALVQMPKYATFMNDILRNKKKLEDHETVMLNVEYNAILLE